jgi:hypothetical protein
VLLGSWAFRTNRRHAFVLGLDCSWCVRRLSFTPDGCMVCLAGLRTLETFRASPDWLRWMDVLRDDPDAKDILADWLEDEGLPDAGADLRGSAWVKCQGCKGKGVVLDEWLWVGPDGGRPCDWAWCFGGKVLVTEIEQRRRRKAVNKEG